MDNFSAILRIMSIATLLSLFCFASCDKTNDGPDKPDEPNEPDTEIEGYTLVWADEFDGQTLDTDSWNIEVNGNGGGNNELQYYREENVGISVEPVSGRRCLTLTARRENFGGRNATSGRINSKGKRFFKYGRFDRSEEHTSELQSLSAISYAVIGRAHV